MGVLTFLDRLDELEKSAERKSTRKDDHAALATLAKRGFDAKERKRLRDLVNLVQSSPELADEAEGAEEEKQAALVQLRAWFDDWTSTARSVVGRRDHLIRLGLAKRRANGKIEDVGDDDPIEDEPTPARPQAAPTHGASAPKTEALAS